MALVELKELQDFCSNKTIAIVGNSSVLLRASHGKEIDSHDVVIRMNHAVRYLDKYSVDTGKKTDIYDCEVSIIPHVIEFCKLSRAKYCTRLIRWNLTEPNPNEQLLINNVQKIYLGEPRVHSQLKNTYFAEKIKPSTGAAVFNFLINFIDYKSINMYGFDFFKSAANIRNRMNEFNSYLYKDHSSELEHAYFKNFINNDVRIQQII